MSNGTRHSPDYPRIDWFVADEIKLTADAAHGFSSEVGGQRSGVRDWTQDERRRVVNHTSEHRSDFTTLFNKYRMIVFREVSIVMGKIEPDFGFFIFAICIGELAHKMCLIPAFCPGLSQICTNRARGASDLIDK